MSGVPTEGGSLLLKLQGSMASMTQDRTQGMALENARRNLPLIRNGKSIAKLRGVQVGEGDSAIIIAAGPSIKQRDPIKRIIAAGYKGAIVCSESAMSYCLRNGVVPDLVISVDPHPMRIVRWFGDPELSRDVIEGDDYFRRQDLDATFSDEMRTNDEMLRLMDRHGKNIKIALSSSASNDVVRRVHEIGMDVYWWNPMLDDPDLPDSATRALARENRLPCVNAGGNVGTSSWMLTQGVLEKRRIALTGVDFGYYGELPYEKTQYYHEAVALVGKDRLDEIFIRIYNPFLERWYYTDPAYYWYRQALLELAQDAECETVNCTEGGILFGDGVRFAPLDDFLAETAR